MGVGVAVTRAEVVVQPGTVMEEMMAMPLEVAMVVEFEQEAEEGRVKTPYWPQRRWAKSATAGIMSC